MPLVQTQMIKTLRLMSNLKQKDVAKILNMSRGAYSKYETGDREPNLEQITKLADYYKVDPTVFFYQGNLFEISIDTPMHEVTRRIGFRAFELEELLWNINSFGDTISKEKLNELLNGARKLHSNIERLKKILRDKLVEESFEEYLERKDVWTEKDRIKEFLNINR